MNVTIIGSKKCVSKNGKDLYVIYASYLQNGVIGQACGSFFTNETNYLELLVGNDYDCAVFFADAENPYNRIFRKKGDN